MKLRELKCQLDDLRYWQNDKRVRQLRDTIIAERKPKIEEIEAQIKALQKPAKLRWQPDTPAHIIAACEEFWNGTTESNTFRIHSWNDKAVWTSYPSGVFYTNGGANKAPATFFLVSLIKKERALGQMKGRVLVTREGRVSQRQMDDLLLENLDLL